MTEKQVELALTALNQGETLSLFNPQVGIFDARLNWGFFVKWHLKELEIWVDGRRKLRWMAADYVLRPFLERNEWRVNRGDDHG